MTERTRISGGTAGTDAERSAFWTRYFVVAFLVLLLESAGVLVYVLVTPELRHRHALVGLAAAGIALAAILLPTSRPLAHKNWRAWFAFGTVLLVGMMLAASCALEGGIDNPLAFMYVLLLSAASLGLTTRLLVICGGVTALELLLLFATHPKTSAEDSQLVVLFVAVVGVVLVGVVASRGRERLEQAESVEHAELEELASTDLLTGCLNHGEFFSRLEAEVDRFVRYGTGVSMLMCDLDRFKSFNDANGHQAGDRALATVGWSCGGRHSRRTWSAGSEATSYRRRGDQAGGSLPRAARARRRHGDVPGEAGGPRARRRRDGRRAAGQARRARSCRLTAGVATTTAGVATVTGDGRPDPAPAPAPAYSGGAIGEAV